MAPSAISSLTHETELPSVVKPPRLYPVKEAHFEKYLEPQPEGYQRAVTRGPGIAAIVIDNGNCEYPLLQILLRKVTYADLLCTGSSATRAGWSFEDAPRFIVPPIMARYRDRKLGRTYAFAGSDVYADTTAKGHMRNAFEAGSGIVSNWDVMESVLDYIFLKMGIDGSEGSVGVPIVMTEAVANLPYSRKCKVTTTLIV